MIDMTVLRRETGAALCTACAKCATSCPLQGFAGFSPVRMITGSAAGGANLAEQALFAQRCLTCEACEVRCPQGVHVAEFARGIRGSVPEGVGAPCPHGRLLQSAAEMGLGQEFERDMSWIGEDLRVAHKGTVALFVGCLPLFDAYFGGTIGVETLEIARSAIRALNGLGIEPVVIADEKCCGHDQLWAGDEEAFSALARSNAEAFRARGVETILTTCAECTRTWRLDYPGVVDGYRPVVRHLVEFLDEKVEAGEITMRTGEATVTYQDPCRLGRHLGVFEAPRRVLGAVPGLELVEMPRSGSDAVCCGTSGFTHCDAASRRLQAERLAEAGATGASILVTACPKCLIHLSCAQAEDRRLGRDTPEVEIQDLSVVAGRFIEVAGKQEATKERTGAVR